MDYHELDLMIAKEIGDRVGEEKACGNLGDTHYGLGDFKTAMDYHKRDLEIAKEIRVEREKEKRMVILAWPIAVWVISKQP